MARYSYIYIHICLYICDMIYDALSVCERVSGTLFILHEGRVGQEGGGVSISSVDTSTCSELKTCLLHATTVLYVSYDPDGRTRNELNAEESSPRFAIHT